MANNVLDPSALVGLLLNILPPTNKTLTSPHDGLAALVHTAFSALSFRLIATDDTSSAKEHPNNVLPDDWNTKGLVDRTFRYRHDQSGLEFVVKVIKLGQRTLISAIAVESDKSASLDVATNDFVSPSFYPYDAAKSDTPPLVHGFISSNRITDFISQLKLKIIQKLIPGLRKEGYIEETEDSSSNAGPAPRAEIPPPAPPRPDSPPYPDDPYFLPPGLRPRNPLEIGRQDLDPFGGINPFQPPSLFPGNGGDGMFVGPGHPIFGMRGNRGQEMRGPWGGDGYLPPMGAPPGARFDPIGPNPGPFNPSFNGRPRRGPPGSGNVRDPDNDEFMPPGAGDMFM
ncbi:PI31 proteasome regulator N-terminal-domain-containing protein [Suillus discolor]|uniref:PI31 proteasome regulator N-terminal-domain-containing protein n=1 Tax=Suillus discolor TaxID=1912936 RepID=A0A9P7FID2_9AGAM|nr:PI31 proteasome regulator N-terminal-domain-containing protein [Suillus discolor]KAG2118873.1 PI31 proteasome regulator N-terminal-domain-containing protein [Suillus discolor]